MLDFATLALFTAACAVLTATPGPDMLLIASRSMSQGRAAGFTIDYAGHECKLNGPSWPFATSVALTAFANDLHARPAPSAAGQQRKLSEEHAALVGNGRFHRAEKTIWNDEDLDIPTYLRRSLTLDR